MIFSLMEFLLFSNCNKLLILFIGSVNLLFIVSKEYFNISKLLALKLNYFSSSSLSSFILKPPIYINNKIPQKKYT